MYIADKYTPDDYLDPKWPEGSHVHNWHNYVSKEVQEMWLSFTPEQRAALARQAEAESYKEEWD